MGGNDFAYSFRRTQNQRLFAALEQGSVAMVVSNSEVLRNAQRDPDAASCGGWTAVYKIV